MFISGHIPLEKYSAVFQYAINNKCEQVYFNAGGNFVNDTDAIEYFLRQAAGIDLLITVEVVDLTKYIILLDYCRLHIIYKVVGGNDTAANIVRLKDTDQFKFDYNCETIYCFMKKDAMVNSYEAYKNDKEVHIL